MDGSNEESGWERSSTSRPLQAGFIIPASSGSLGLLGGGTSMGEEVEEDEGVDRLCAEERSFDSRLKIAGRHGDKNTGEVSLREWLDRLKRPVDSVECLHIFRQVVEAVNLAHSQGVVVNNIKPSCFVMSSFRRVTFIESASCSSSASEDLCGEEGSADAMESVGHAARLCSAEELEGRRELDVGIDVMERREFPLKRILSLEMNWYTSPEEAEGGQATFSSDIYKLGVLLFELVCQFDTFEEKLCIMSNLRHRVLPPQMLLRWPKEASFCLWLLHPKASSRPTMSQLLQSEFLNEKKDCLEERESAIKLKEEIEEQEILLDFLLQLQKGKIEAADKLHDTICFLHADIEEVEKRRSILTDRCSFVELEKADNEPVHRFDCLPSNYETIEETVCSGSRKRIKPGYEYSNEDKSKDNHLDDSRSEAKQEIIDRILSKSSRIMKNFKKLEAAYFSSRCRSMKPSDKLVSRKLRVSNLSSASTIKTEGSSVDYLASVEEQSGNRIGEWVNPFLEGLCKYLTFSRFRVVAEVKQGDLLNSSNLICSLAFDRDKELLATGGQCLLEWLHKEPDCLSDFDGVIQIWDFTRSEVLFQMREHSKRVWSVHYSLADPTKLASGSDDGTVKLWNINQGGSTGTIRTKANVCSVQFPPDSASALAIGSADHNVYYYDLRNIKLPLFTMVGHTKTVSYVKFVDPLALVSSSTDSSLKLWDLSESTSRVLDNPIQTFTGHTNVKNFVGLSISDGYIATGSETNEVFVYHKAFPMPAFSFKFGFVDPISGLEADDANQFISCVCWRGDSPTLVVANSSGCIKVLEMV
ncbi:hypothetical protein HPP92_020057 [Vanilla planifolia]|uniref:hydroxymethylglutaryl-CoA reductase (NADPH) n=1 Tax=Vanilla planifolia TaxID=51239 RepID=A0A835UJR5_VANPL|nr:hypothetical protein HPP92_020057 [Vanilla planifolia]